MLRGEKKEAKIRESDSMLRNSMKFASLWLSFLTGKNHK